MHGHGNIGQAAWPVRIHLGSLGTRSTRKPDIRLNNACVMSGQLETLGLHTECKQGSGPNIRYFLRSWQHPALLQRSKDPIYSID